MQYGLGLVQKCIDGIFPPSAEAQLVRELNLTDLLQRISLQHTGDIYSLLSYEDNVVKALIHEAKFHYNKNAYKLLAGALAHYLKCQSSSTILLPVPLSSARYRARGYNQVTEVARAATTRVPHATLRTAVLVRTRDTRAQTELNRVDRLTNVVDAFCVPRKTQQKSLYGKNIIILDDVMTTGATLRAAKAALLPHSPKCVTLLALAH